MNCRGDGNATRGGKREAKLQQEMKRVDNAWELLYSFEWLEEANRNARKGKRYRSEILAFQSKLDENILEIQRAMMDGSYVLGPYRRKWVYVPKKRIVMALGYPDRIVQWSLYQFLNPIYDRLFIEDSYACRKGKGSHKAADRLQYWMRQADRKAERWYYLKLDISKYFYRVDHKTLLEIMQKRITDETLREFLRKIVDSTAEPFGLPPGKKPEEVDFENWLYDCGMPIGNLTSQMFANIYLNELDQYCKHTLRIHYYIRYMDDIIILAPAKEEARRLQIEIERQLKETLLLDLNRKTAIRPISMGVEFVGVKIWTTHRKLRKSTVRRLKREVSKITEKYAAGTMSKTDFYRRVASIKGMLEHTESESLRQRLNEIYKARMQKTEKIFG